MHSVENVILRGIFYVVSRFPLHFMLYRGNFDYFFDVYIYSISELHSRAGLATSHNVTTRHCNKTVVTC